MAEERQRNFCFELYPESMDPDAFEKLEDLHVPMFISPLHNMDKTPDGEIKKPHYHVMVLCEGKKSKSQRNEIIKCVKGVAPDGGYIPPSVRGYARYLCHLDNKDKAQYDTDLVIQLSGANYQNVISLTEDKYKAVTEMKNWCKENDIFYYSDLLDYAAAHRNDWFRSLCDNSTVVLLNYIKSLKYKAEQGLREKIQAEDDMRYIELMKSLNAKLTLSKEMQSYLDKIEPEK